MLEQLRGVLRSLKWSDYETLAYATLVEKGAMTPQELVYETDIPSGRIYDIIKSLEKRGALLGEGGKPKKYDAQNPRSILFSELAMFEKEIDKALPSAEQAWEKRASSLSSGDTFAWTVQGQKAIVTQIRTLMQYNPTSLLICDSDLSWLGRRDHKILRRMISGKKDARIIGQTSFKEDLEYLDNLGVDVRINAGGCSDRCIINGSVLITKIGSPPSGLVIREIEYVRKAIQEFEKDFKASKRLEVKKVAP